MEREITLDVETTGLYALSGDRMIDIGCVELINHVATKNVFQVYLNPLRDVPENVIKIHGITAEFLADKPTFPEVADDLLDFIGDSKIIIHNASFDMGFINNELKLANKELIKMNRVIDTLEIAKRMFPGDSKSLDSLCCKFGIDNSSRTKHGALLDAELLAGVYLELIGGHEPTFMMGGLKDIQKGENKVERAFHAARKFPISDEENRLHEEFLDEITNPIWRKEKED